MSKTAWSVQATPVGRYWHLTVTGLAGATQARSAKEIEPMARDFIAINAEKPPRDIALDISYVLPDDVTERLNRAAQLRATADTARKQAAAEWRQAAKDLKASGMTVRHIGEALGISHQRAQQLIRS